MRLSVDGLWLSALENSDVTFVARNYWAQKHKGPQRLNSINFLNETILISILKYYDFVLYHLINISITLTHIK